MGEDGLEFDEVDRAIINAFQGGFPVVHRPFEAAAQALSQRGVDITAGELVDRVRWLDEEGALTRFGALINAEEIGGAATLVAIHAPEDRFDEIAELVNDHTEVAHNYERDHPHLNMWFVVSVADPDRIDKVLAEIEAETGQETYNLPKQREFRVEAKFLVDGPLHDEDIDLSHLGTTPKRSDRDTLTADERALVLEIQEGLPITDMPYEEVAETLSAARRTQSDDVAETLSAARRSDSDEGEPADDVEVEWVLETIRRFNEEGKIRRVGVIPNHYALGYTENGMTVWNVPDDLVSTVGRAVASLEFVTHCYQRPRHEGVWPYNFFAMTHGRSETESQERIEQVRDVMAEHWDVAEEPSSARRTESDDVEDEDWDTLFSTRILKKTGIRLDERTAANVEE